MQENILLTGSAGFIGFHLSKALLDKGYRVIGVDNFLTGQKENIKVLASNNNFSFIEADVCQPFPVSDQLSYIFHFASPASPADFQRLSTEIAMTNSLGTLNLLRLAQEKQAYMLFASTSEVYGDPLVHPQKETDFGHVNTLGQRSCYDESKRLGEALVADFMRQEKIKGNIFRIFNTYGPNMRPSDGRIVTNFISQALDDQPLTIYGSGQQTRSLCYISDLVEAILTVSIANRKQENQAYNIGNDQERKVIEIAQEVLKQTGKNLELKHLPDRPDEPQKRCPDLGKIKRDFGWQPKINLEEGLRKTIEYWQRL
jgi:nucleoside-diphosphate-sugar epimerase